MDEALAQLGVRYGVRCALSLARYFFPVSLIPARWRRHALVHGGALTTQIVCSTLIARAFQQVGFPILPAVTPREPDPDEQGWRRWLPAPTLPASLPPRADRVRHAARLRPLALLRRGEAHRRSHPQLRLPAYPLGLSASRPPERRGVPRLRTQLLRDHQEAVVLRRALRARRCTGLDLSRTGGDREIGDERVLGLARAVRDDVAVARLRLRAPWWPASR